MTNTLNENGHWVQDNKLDTNSSLERNMDETYSSNHQETNETNGTNLNESLNDEDSNGSSESLSDENLSIDLSEMNDHSNHNDESTIHIESPTIHKAAAPVRTHHNSIYNNHLGCTSPEVLEHIDEAIDNVVKHFRNDLNQSSPIRSSSTTTAAATKTTSTPTTTKNNQNNSSSSSKVTKSTKVSSSNKTKSKKKSKNKNHHHNLFFDHDDLPFEIGSSKKKKNDDKSAANKKKDNSTGPFIRVEKKKNQVNYIVVNNSSKLEDKDNKLFNKPNYSSIAKKSSNQILFKPNDPTWVCVFCKRAPHYKQLGDLFGPHELICDKNLENNNSLTTNSNGNSTNQQPSTSHHNNTVAPIKSEIWFHEDCIIWSNGIYLAGNRVRNIDEIVIECSDITCCACKLIGANLGCVQKGCNQTFHYICAKESGCELNEENFSMFCQNHKKSINAQEQSD